MSLYAEHEGKPQKWQKSYLAWLTQKATPGQHVN